MRSEPGGAQNGEMRQSDNGDKVEENELGSSR